MRFEDLISSGLSASQANDSAQALGCFQRARTEDPSSGLPPFLLGTEFAALGEYDKAESAFADAVRLAPDFSIARYQLGLLQFSSGRASVGLLTWQALLSLPDSDPLPHFVRGFNELAQDQFIEALAHYELGLQRNSSNPALSQDVEKVMTGIRELLAKASGVSPSEGDTQDVNASAHVLLANYQQGDTTRH